MRAANGIYLNGAPGNLVQRNRAHDNQDSGIQYHEGSHNTISLQNRSWNNGDHGYDLGLSTGTLHIGDVASGNFRHGFSVQGNATGTQIFNSIGVNNGLTGGEGVNLLVDPPSTPDFRSDFNVWWNATSQAPIRYNLTNYATLAAFTAATGHDATSLQADPRFLDPGGGNFALQSGSPAIDAADSSLAAWPATDAAGRARADDPATANSGAGPVPYADRGALEFLPFGPPLAALTVTPPSGGPPLTVMADASRSADPDGTIVAYRFAFGDGTVVGPQAEATASHTYQQLGTFTVTVMVTDNEGGTDAATARVTVTQPPVAALTVTPVWGAVPLTVTADASGSRDPDGTIVSYRFDFGDGGVARLQGSPTATQVYWSAGIFTATVTVTDDAGATAAATATVTVAEPPDENLVENPSFELGTQGWSAFGDATLHQVAGGIEGAFALEVRGTGSPTAFGINDSPNFVARTPAAGTRYRFTAWVRSAVHTGEARLRVREYSNGLQIGPTVRSAPVTLSPAWQMLTLDFVTGAAGSTLDFQVLDYIPVTTGEVFQVDNIAIVVVP